MSKTCLFTENGKPCGTEVLGDGNYCEKHRPKSNPDETLYVAGGKRHWGTDVLYNVVDLLKGNRKF